MQRVSGLAFRIACRPSVVVPRRVSRHGFSCSARSQAVESHILGPLGISSLNSKSESGARMARSLFSSIEGDEAAKQALSRVIHLSQQAGVSPKMWLDSPDEAHPLRQLLQQKQGRLLSLAENDLAFRGAVDRFKSELRRLGILDSLDLLFLLVDAQSGSFGDWGEIPPSS